MSIELALAATLATKNQPELPNLKILPGSEQPAEIYSKPDTTRNLLGIPALDTTSPEFNEKYDAALKVLKAGSEAENKETWVNAEEGKHYSLQHNGLLRDVQVIAMHPYTIRVKRSNGTYIRVAGTDSAETTGSVTVGTADRARGYIVQVKM